MLTKPARWALEGWPWHPNLGGVAGGPPLCRGGAGPRYHNQTQTNQPTTNKKKPSPATTNHQKQFNKQTSWCCGCGVLLCCRGLREVGATEQGGACEGCPRHAGKQRGRRCLHSQAPPAMGAWHACWGRSYPETTHSQSSWGASEREQGAAPVGYMNFENLTFSSWVRM